MRVSHYTVQGTSHTGESYCRTEKSTQIQADEVGAVVHDDGLPVGDAVALVAHWNAVAGAQRSSHQHSLLEDDFEMYLQIIGERERLRAEARDAAAWRMGAVGSVSAGDAIQRTLVQRLDRIDLMTDVQIHQSLQNHIANFFENHEHERHRA